MEQLGLVLTDGRDARPSFVVVCPHALLVLSYYNDDCMICLVLLQSALCCADVPQKYTIGSVSIIIVLIPVNA